MVKEAVCGPTFSLPLSGVGGTRSLGLPIPELQVSTKEEGSVFSVGLVEACTSRWGCFDPACHQQPSPLHSSKSLTQGVGLSLVLRLWDLPELCSSVPVRGEAQMEMTQSGIQAHCGRELPGGSVSNLGNLRQEMQQAPKISWSQVPGGKSS